MTGKVVEAIIISQFEQSEKYMWILGAQKFTMISWFLWGVVLGFGLLGGFFYVLGLCLGVWLFCVLCFFLF